MNRIERDIFKIITGRDNVEYGDGNNIELTKRLAKKFEEGIREAFLQGCISNKLELTDYLKSIKE